MFFVLTTPLIVLLQVIMEHTHVMQLMILEMIVLPSQFMLLVSFSMTTKYIHVGESFVGNKFKLLVNNSNKLMYFVEKTLVCQYTHQLSSSICIN